MRCDFIVPCTYSQAWNAGTRFMQVVATVREFSRLRMEGHGPLFIQKIRRGVKSLVHVGMRLSALALTPDERFLAVTATGDLITTKPRRTGPGGRYYSRLARKVGGAESVRQLKL